MKIQYNCSCGAKLIIYSWFRIKLLTKLVESWSRRHCNCHKKHLTTKLEIKGA